MPRKQKQRNNNNTSKSNGFGHRSSATDKRSNGDGGFPPHLLCRRGAAGAPETLVRDAVFVARNVLSPEECRAWIKYGDEANLWETVSHPATKWVAHREYVAARVRLFVLSPSLMLSSSSFLTPRHNHKTMIQM